MNGLTGKCSFFGGATDAGMDFEEGLAYYTHEEADLRPDLFLPRSSATREGAAKRLRNAHANYIALRMEGDRIVLRQTLWKIKNPKTGQFVIASLVDYGPGTTTGRVVDLSDAIGRALRLETDDEVEVDMIYSPMTSDY